MTNNPANNCSIPLEQFVDLTQELGVTKTALEKLLQIIQQQNPFSQADAFSLRTLAKQYLKLLNEVVHFQSNDPEITALLNQTKQVLEQGDFEQAEDLINQAKDKDLLAAKKISAQVNQRLLSAAEGAARNGELKLLQIKHVEAAEYFQEAAEIVPAGFAEKLVSYLNKAGNTWQSVHRYSEAEPLYFSSLVILEKTLGNDHPFVATALSTLAELYQIQGKEREAEPLYLRRSEIYCKRILAVKEITLGKNHPDVANDLDALAEIYKTQGQYAKAETLYQRSLTILEASLGKDHPNTHVARENLDSLQCLNHLNSKALRCNNP